MKRLATLLSLMAVACLSVTAQVGTWKAFMSYYEPQQIAKVGDKLYVRASNGLYNYNLNDHSITTYDKVRQLNDCKVNNIAWNPQVGRLIIIYDNSNIDLLDTNDNVVNISALYSKTMTQDKTVNAIYIYKEYAYLATAFGVVKVNMQRAEISESYILNEDIRELGIDGDKLFLRNKDKKFFVGDLNQNLIDPHNWSETSAPNSSIYTQDQTDWNENIGLVSTLIPEGPKYNNFGFMLLKNKMLYTAGGGLSGEKPGTIQVLSVSDENDWSIFQEDVKDNFPGTESSTWKFVNTFSIDVDPLDNKHVFAGGRTGLYEYYDGELQHYYNKDNSILNSATTSNKYVLVESVMFDQEGSLWLLQSQVSDNSIIKITKDGEWISYPHSELMNGSISLEALSSLIQDSRGLIWFVNNHWDHPSFFCYDPKTDQIINSFKNFNNQDGLSYNSYNPRSLTEDLDHNVWVNTLKGPFYVDNDNIYTQDPYLTQVKVPRNDGTNYADYLLSDVDIKCMVVDGGGRKWFGSSRNGVYVISADNMTQVAHYTTSNSPLLSDRIESIAIDNETGEVFFGTENGLCSYMSDATNAVESMEKDLVYAYPNPVVSGYDGLITINGLSMDADVKILSTSGQLVAQGRSNGGTFTWNGRDRSGKRVASGVYMVAAATSDGKKGTVCKIAIIR